MYDLPVSRVNHVISPAERLLQPLDVAASVAVNAAVVGAREVREDVSVAGSADVEVEDLEVELEPAPA